jgi:hypothetical protein
LHTQAEPAAATPEDLPSAKAVCGLIVQQESAVVRNDSEESELADEDMDNDESFDDEEIVATVVTQVVKIEPTSKDDAAKEKAQVCSLHTFPGLKC